jgi:hypothetical protein
LPECEACKMCIPYTSLNGRHHNSNICKQGQELLRHRQQQDQIQKARGITIELRNATIPNVTTFTYLGRDLAANNSNWPALYKNLRKAQTKWALISRPLLRTGVSPRYVGYFYNAIVQSVLLYGAETWTVTPQMLEPLNSFHHKIARCISNMMPVQEPNDTWYYPPLSAAMETAGLFTIAEYIKKQQGMLAQYVINQPIMRLCQQETQDDAYANSCMYRWWTQPLRTNNNSSLDSKSSNDVVHNRRGQGLWSQTPTIDAETIKTSSGSADKILHRSWLHIPVSTTTPSSEAAQSAISTTSSLTTANSHTVRGLLPHEQLIMDSIFNQDPSTSRVSAPTTDIVTVQTFHTLKP